MSYEPLKNVTLINVSISVYSYDQDFEPMCRAGRLSYSYDQDFVKS